MREKVDQPKVDAFCLDGQVAVVTGGGQGLGSAISIGLASQGARVGILDIDGEAAGAVALAIEQSGGHAAAIAADVSNRAAVNRAFESLGRTLGPVQVLINNAGVQSHVRPEVLSDEEWNRVMDVNLRSYLLCAQAVFEHMRQGGRGSIVNISSINGVSAVGRGNLVYSVSKSGVLQLTRELAIEWAQYQIRVNSILPCQFKTRLLGAMVDREDEADGRLIHRMLDGIPLGRFGEMEDIVGPVVFLASSASAMVTGIALPVDGGNLALNAGGSLVW